MPDVTRHPNPPADVRPLLFSRRSQPTPGPAFPPYPQPPQVDQHLHTFTELRAIVLAVCGRMVLCNAVHVFLPSMLAHMQRSSHLRWVARRCCRARLSFCPCLKLQPPRAATLAFYLPSLLLEGGTILQVSVWRSDRLFAHGPVGCITMTFEVVSHTQLSLSRHCKVAQRYLLLPTIVQHFGNTQRVIQGKLAC